MLAFNLPISYYHHPLHQQSQTREHSYHQHSCKRSKPSCSHSSGCNQQKLAISHQSHQTHFACRRHHHHHHHHRIQLIQDRRHAHTHSAQITQPPLHFNKLNTASRSSTWYGVSPSLDSFYTYGNPDHTCDHISYLPLILNEASPKTNRRRPRQQKQKKASTGSNAPESDDEHRSLGSDSASDLASSSGSRSRSPPRSFVMHSESVNRHRKNILEHGDGTEHRDDILDDEEEEQEQEQNNEEEEEQEQDPQAMQDDEPQIQEPQHSHIVDDFIDLELIERVRAEFDAAFRDPRELHSKRFVWDYWHMPNQYSHHRTPAAEFFSEQVYAAIEDQLIQFGQTYLGCSSITPIWLSYYTHGARQELHADIPHGPWAFVLSLTRDKDIQSSFRGGETFMLQPHVLDYWNWFSYDTVVEADKLVHKIKPNFNRLIIFDSRIPHGVVPVEGTRDPSEARIVLHGWFAQPSPSLIGGLAPEQVEKPLNKAVTKFSNYLKKGPKFLGLLTSRIIINGNGSVEKVEIICNTLVVAATTKVEAQEARADFIAHVESNLAQIVFPKSADNSDTIITFPLVCQ